jgi:1-acyl-sn-glycerol-3-phosphate acyltransferase
MPFKQQAALWALRLIGWKCLDLPQRPTRAVVIAYPHTSNWDFPIGLLALAALGLNARWVAKDTLFRGPLGPPMRWLGGIAVNRRERTGFVERLATELRHHEDFMLVIAPEGTRSLTAGWKTGFYRIALAADVPVLVGKVDYARREIGLLASIVLTGAEVADMARIAGCYQERCGKRPELAAPIRLI